MSTNLTEEQRFRYLNDAEFHARVTVVARALWSAVARWDLKHSTPYPYDRLIPATQDDLVEYAIEAVEALEEFERAMADPTDTDLPDDLARVLRDQSIIVPQDAGVFDLIGKWRDAPSNTASAKAVCPNCGRPSPCSNYGPGCP